MTANLGRVTREHAKYQSIQSEKKASNSPFARFVFSKINLWYMLKMKTRNSSDGSVEAPSKRPCAGEGVRSSAPTLMGILQVLVETEWIGVRELGRVEQASKACKISESIWSALCFLKMPSMEDKIRDFIMEAYGSFRRYYHMHSLPRENPSFPMVDALGEEPTEDTEMFFVVDIFMDGKPINGQAFRIRGIIAEKGAGVYRLRTPIELGKAICLDQKKCQCTRKCIWRFDQRFCIGVRLERLGLDVVTIAAKDAKMLLGVKGDNGPLFEPERDNEGKTYKTGGRVKYVTNLANGYRDRKYEKLGLAFRNTPLSTEINGRLEHRPIEISVSLSISILPDKKTYGIAGVAFALVYGELIERTQRGDRIEWYLLGDDEGQRRFGIKPMYVFNELKGTSLK